MSNNNNINFLQLASVALFSALFAFSSYIKLPLPLLPITAQSFFIMLAGLLLGSRLAVLAVSLWLLLGLFGLPVFSGNASGLAIFFMPNGGYLLGYVLMAFFAGLAKHMPIFSNNKALPVRASIRTVHLLPALLSVYVIGLPWLRWRMGVSANAEGEMELMTWKTVLLSGFWPFLIPDLIKAFLAAFTYEALVTRKKK